MGEGCVLDASALLCLIGGEAGADRVAEALPSAVISAVSLAEVADRLAELGIEAETARALLAPLHLTVVPFDAAAAFAAAALGPATRGLGLSPGGRACLALARARRVRALTREGAWAEAGALLGVEVEGVA